MANSKLNQFLAGDTAAVMGGFTPTPPTPAAGPKSGYLFFQTDTGLLYSWNATTPAWQEVTATPAAVASHDVLSNITSGSATPVGNTLTATIDAAISSTQGDILYRSATAGSPLRPARMVMC